MIAGRGPRQARSRLLSYVVHCMLFPYPWLLVASSYSHSPMPLFSVVTYPPQQWLPRLDNTITLSHCYVDKRPLEVITLLGKHAQYRNNAGLDRRAGCQRRHGRGRASTPPTVVEALHPTTFFGADQYSCTLVDATVSFLSFPSVVSSSLVVRPIAR